jgi:hypothetical protein
MSESRDIQLDLRRAMMIDADHQRADAQFYAACDVQPAVDEPKRQRRAKWQKAYQARPERRDKRNTQKRESRANR